jgi:hypothetical protein
VAVESLPRPEVSPAEKTADITVRQTIHNDREVVLLIPHTDAADQWLAAHAADAERLCGAFIVPLDEGVAIVQVMVADGLVLR